MTSMATYAGKTAAKIGHAHPQPSFRKPWWYWACIQCTPDLYQKVTRQGRGPYTSKKCPWCHEKAPVQSGVLPMHSTHGEICPVSGMNRATAAAMLEAAVNRRPIFEALEWARFTCAEDVETQAPVERLHPVMEELREHVKMSGRSGREISICVGLPETSFYKWWDVRKDNSPSPRLKSVLAVTHEIGLHMVIRHSLGVFEVDDYESLSAATRWIRDELGIDGATLGHRLGISESVANRRDKGERSIGIVAASDWVEALGGRLEFRRVERG